MSSKPALEFVVAARLSLNNSLGAKSIKGVNSYLIAVFLYMLA